MLDTNICIFLIKQKSNRLVETLVAKNPRDIFISAVTVSELYFGVENSQTIEKNKVLLETFLIPFQILDFDLEAAKSFGQLKAELKREGKAIGGAQDLQIASHARACNLTLVTNDQGFKQGSSIKVEDWT
ncbi:MAG: type II toxin-antitoxin system VapC family toxin [Oligoflexus sp.]|nr:type II toxin-antitoxin system VapC family toxin [Oligoflexus sp.]